MVNTGVPSVIRKVGGRDETRRFLENLGFVAGGIVTVISEIGGADGREYDCECKGFQSCDRERYGE